MEKHIFFHLPGGPFIKQVQAVLMVGYVCKMCAHKPFQDMLLLLRPCGADVRRVYEPVVMWTFLDTGCYTRYGWLAHQHEEITPNTFLLTHSCIFRPAIISVVF